jgi:outer membrane protein OmpA-like peptidoglycan-associated protein
MEIRINKLEKVADSKPLIITLLFFISSCIGYGQLEQEIKKYSFDEEPTLPYRFTSFTAKHLEGKTYIMWTVIEPEQHSFFVLERSFDNKTYDPIYTKSGAKSPHNIELLYSYVDSSDLDDTVYYRVSRISNHEEMKSKVVRVYNKRTNTYCNCDTVRQINNCYDNYLFALTSSQTAYHKPNNYMSWETDGKTRKHFYLRNIAFKGNTKQHHKRSKNQDVTTKNQDDVDKKYKYKNYKIVNWSSRYVVAKNRNHNTNKSKAANTDSIFNLNKKYNTKRHKLHPVIINWVTRTIVKHKYKYHYTKNSQVAKLDDTHSSRRKDSSNSFKRNYKVVNWLARNMDNKKRITRVNTAAPTDVIFDTTESEQDVLCLENVEAPMVASTEPNYYEIKKEATPNPMVVGAKFALKNIFFDFDKATLKSSSDEELTNLVNILNNNPHIKIEIAAHTDNKGNDAYNLKLSQARAQTVVNHLIQKGIDTSRMRAKGYGETMPVASNTNADGSDNSEGRKLNRRVEFEIIGME